MDRTVIYTDGACSGNPGPGGAAAVIISQEKAKELSRGYRLTTSNRMEVVAVILALENLSEAENAVLYTDSRYIIDTMTKGWLGQWIRKGWRLSDGKAVKNTDLWQKISRLVKTCDIEWQWIEGHSGNRYNDRCNQLAVKASKDPTLIDEEYEQNQNPLGL